MNRNGSAAGLVLMVVGAILLGSSFFIPFSLAGDRVYVTTYPSTPPTGGHSYDIYMGKNEYALWKYYVNGFWDTNHEYNTIQDAKGFIDDLNAGATTQYGAISVSVRDTAGAWLAGALIEVSGQPSKTSSGTEGTQTWTHLPLGTYTVVISKTPLRTDTRYIELTTPGQAASILVVLTPQTPEEEDEVTVIISCSEGGQTSPSGVIEYPIGATVTLNAVPNTGYQFIHWSENGIPTTKSASFTFSADEDVNWQAVFKANNATEPELPITSYLVVGVGIALFLIGLALYIRRK